MLQNNTPDLTTILQDLARSGVTDIIGESGHNWFAVPKKTSSKSTAVPVTKAVTATAPPPRKETPPKPQKIIPPILTGKAEQLLIITGSLKNTPALTADETELLKSMLEAIGIDIAKTAILAVPVADKYGTPFANVDAYKKELEKPVGKMIIEAKPPAILALGQVAVHMAAGAEQSLSDAREKQNLTCNSKVLGVTYHPRTLLKQPLLKRMAWQDLLSFQTRLQGS